MTRESREPILEPEYWDIVLRDGSSIRVLTDSYTVEGNELVFGFSVSNHIGDIESLRISFDAIQDDYSHWNGDSYGEFQSIITEVLTTRRLDDKACWYCAKVNTLHFYLRGKKNAEGTATLWCSFCWHNTSEKVIVPTWWITLKKRYLPKFPETPREMGDFQQLVDEHWEIVNSSQEA